MQQKLNANEQRPILSLVSIHDHFASLFLDLSEAEHHGGEGRVEKSHKLVLGQQVSGDWEQRIRCTICFPKHCPEDTYNFKS